MPDESDTRIDFFSSIPDEYGGTAVMDAPATPTKQEPAPVVTDEPKELEIKKPNPAASPDDLLAPKKEGGEKSPAQYAKERREAKEQKRELIAKAPVLEEENARLKSDYEAAQARLAELEARNIESVVPKEEAETLRARAEAAEKRYIASNGPSFDPYQDEEVVRHARAVEDALKANLPKFTRKADGSSARINLDVLRKTPERKQAMDQAVAHYAHALNTGDDAGLDKAVMLMNTALGGLDIEDDDVRTHVETALSAAAEPFTKGLDRFKHVQENAVGYATQRRAEQIRVTESRLLQPLQFDPTAVDEALESDPSHPWANFGKLINEMPDEFRKEITDELRQDALVVGAMRYTPPPLPSNATAQQIAEHEAIVRSSEERAGRAAQYLAVGRAMIDGGVLAHLRSQVAEMQERLNETAGSTAVPRSSGGSGGATEQKPNNGGVWDSISSNYGSSR